jgi:hypothetical protein
MAQQLPHLSLREEDWDFSGCPAGELFDCWVYEFAREYHRRHGSIPAAWRVWFPFGADFPQTPYLSVSRATPSKEDYALTVEFLKEHPLRPVVEAKEGDQPDVCLKIDWQFSDTVLLKWMGLFLKEKRPRDATLGVGRPKEFDADLKQLGAFRLLKIAKLSISQATEYSKKHRKGVIEIPLYANQPTWSMATTKVEKIMVDFPSEMAKLTP